jgi:cation:H+ antiporter
MLVVAVLVGLALLAWAPDRFVGSAAALAARWQVSPVLIGAVVLGLGTSTPEMLVSAFAARDGDADVGVGNVIGSNIANLGLVLGLAALVGSIGVAEGTLRTEVPLVAAATVGFALAVQGGGISVPEAAALALGLAAALAITVRRASARDPADADLASEMDDYLAHEGRPGAAVLARDLALGLGGIVVGAQALVWGAVELAESFDVSGGFVGVTLVAVGTSIPEIVTSITAARAGEDDLVLGNVLGSNLFNCLAVGAVIGFAGGGTIDDTTLTTLGVALMLAMTAAASVVMAAGRRVTNAEAVGLLAGYAVTLVLLA